MSIWIRAICRRSVEFTTPEELLTGITKRLMLLTYLYGEDDYEETTSRLRVENASRVETFEVYRIYYRQSGNSFIRVARWSKPSAVAEEVKELVESLEDRREPEAEMIRQLLAETIETVGLELKQSDADGMGWPVAIAAAAYLADKGKGVVHDGQGWLQPTAKEVHILIDLR
jgi:hypothetical protein